MKSLRELRKLNGFTLAMLRIKTNVTIAQLSRMENGLSVPSRATRKTLEKFFGEQINWLNTEYIYILPHKPTQWLDVEIEFRRFCRLLTGLSENNKKKFIPIACKYLKKLK